MGSKKKFFSRDAELLEIRAVGRPRECHGGEPAKKPPQRHRAAPAGRCAPEKMGIAAKDDRNPPAPGPGDRAEVGGPLVAEEQERVGAPGVEAPGQPGIVEAPEFFRARRSRAVAHKLAPVSGKQIDVPGEHRFEPGIALRRNTEVPKIEYAKIHRGALREPAEPGAVILRRM